MNEKMRAISGTTALGLFVLCVIAYIWFSWNAKALNLPDWITTVVGPCFTYVIYYFWRKGEKQKSDFKPLILHIENNAVQQSVLDFGLRKEGLDYSLQPFDSGEKALEWLTRRDFLRVKPDVIVLDLSLGAGMNGQDFLARIKSNQDLFDIPVIILSSTPRGDAERQDIIDTCSFYIERDEYAGIKYLKEAILSCDPREAKTPFEELSIKCEEYRKINQEWRQIADSLKVAIVGGSPADKQRAIGTINRLLSKASELSGRWSLRRLNDKE